MISRLCGNCHKHKPSDLFNWKNKSLGLRHSVCKECHAKYRRQHYLDNRRTYIAKALKWNSNQRLKLQKVVLNYLSNNSCVDCGETDVLVLDFDHKTAKIKGIAEMVQDSCSERHIVAEIGKCEVRCANCHRRKTAKQFSYWKTLMGA